MSYALRPLKLPRAHRGSGIVFCSEPQREVGAARALERAAARGVVLLHQRQVPHRSGSIDHLAIGPGGVTLIDANRDRGRIAVECRGGLLRDHTEHLVVGDRDCTEIVDDVLAQAEAVRQVLADSPRRVPVRAVLCFVDGDWPWSGRLEVRGVPVVAPRRAAELCATGDLSAAAVTAIETVLRARLAPA